VARVGFVVNPIAGLGGRVGLKGSDDVSEEALRRGASPVAPSKASEMLEAFATCPQAEAVSWLTCSGPMGGDALAAAGFTAEVVYRCTPPTGADDTERACRAFLERRADLVVFVGGDGTARDVVAAVDGHIPIVGVPSGVKMHSAVFAVHSMSVAAILADFVDGRTATVDAEILDLDEEKYRQGEWVVRLFGTAKTLHEPTLIQTGKMMFEEIPEASALDGIAEHVMEEMEAEPQTLYFLGPGGTLHHLKERLGIAGTLLGIDAVRGKALVAADLDEAAILRLLEAHPAAKLVLSPIGAQGFLLGRGNLQVSPEVVRRIGVSNLVVVATPDKLLHTPELRVDTGDPALDRSFAEKEYLFVVQGYRELKVHPIRA
jgi:predicted polyphosphate/ATP-dependent NAD kinase